MKKITWNSCPVCKTSPRKKGNCKPKQQNYFDESLGNYYIWCDNCGLQGPYGEDEQDSINKWNRLKYADSVLFEKQIDR